MKIPFKPVYNVAVIGCGILARQQHIPNVQRHPHMRLHTCCDIQAAILTDLKKEYPDIHTTTDFREAVESPEIDIVIVATGEDFRVPILEAAAGAGKAVIMEKPLCDTWENALKIYDVITQSQIPFCVAHNRRCAPAMVAAQRIFRKHMSVKNAQAWRFRRDGWPEIHQIVKDEEGTSAMSIRVNDDWWSWKSVHLRGENAEIGLLLHDLTHFVDIACWFFDAEPQTVGVLASGVLNQAITIKFTTGDIAGIVMGGNGSFGYPKELVEVFGNGGMLVVDHMLEIRSAGIEGIPMRITYSMVNDRHPNVAKEGGMIGWLEKKRFACSEAAEHGQSSLQFTAEPDKGHFAMLGAFIEEIRGEREPVSPVEDALLAMKTCLAAIRSMREKRFVDLDEIS